MTNVAQNKLAGRLPIVCAAVLLVGMFASAAGSAESTYPPYPDKWDLEIPASERPILHLQPRKLPNGDILFSYQACCGENRWRTLTFFENRRYASVEDAFGGKFPLPSDTWQYQTSEGHTIQTFGTGTGRYQGCYDGLDAYVSLFEGPVDSPKTRLPKAQKTILYLLDKPREHRSQPHCNESRTFRYWAQSLGGRLVPLDDKTFLLVDVAHGVAIRMDERLQTKSKMLGHRLFVVDTEEFGRRFGGAYGSRADGGRDFRRLHADLHRWLLGLRKGDEK